MHFSVAAGNDAPNDTFRTKERLKNILAIRVHVHINYTAKAISVIRPEERSKKAVRLGLVNDTY